MKNPVLKRPGQAMLLGAVFALLTAAPLMAAEENLSTVERVARARVFSQPLVWVGQTPPNEGESQALLAAIQGSRGNGSASGVAPLENYTRAHLNSPWTPALRAYLAKHYYDIGRYTLALEHWEAVWAETKDATEGQAKRVADYTLAHWARLLASLGRLETLQQILKETKGRVLDGGPLQQRFFAARAGVRTMATEPGVGYRCGTYALYNAASILNLTNRVQFNGIRDIPSPHTGFSLKQLDEISAKHKLPFVAVKRMAGQELVVPSVVHWRQNHYAAITARKGNLYEVVDPTFRLKRWMTAETINAETDGYFLMPGEHMIGGWRRLSRSESESVFGRGYPADIDQEQDESCYTDHLTCPPDCPPGANDGDHDSHGGKGGVCSSCQSGGGVGPRIGSIEGMVRWRVSEPFTSLWLEDEPLGYQPSRGQRVSFRLNYKQRDTRPMVSDIFNFGSQENSSWLSYFEITTLESGEEPFFDYTYEARLFCPGGGERGYESWGFPTNTIQEAISRTSLTISYTNNDIASITINHPNGGQSVYGYGVNYTTGPAKLFLTQIIDPHSNTTALDYYETNSVVRLNTVVDVDNQTTTLAYNHPTNLSLITGISDPFSRAVSLQYTNYNENYFLYSITDPEGIASTMVYDWSKGCVTNLTTPYGGTTFIPYDAPWEEVEGVPVMQQGPVINYAMQVIEPGINPAKHLYIFRANTTYLNTNDQQTETIFIQHPSDVGKPLQKYSVGSNDITLLDHGNTFYWSPKQFNHLSTNNMFDFTTNDHFIARQRVWAMSNRVVIPVLQMERSGSPDGVNRGQMVWYEYPMDEWLIPTSYKPKIKAQILPSGDEEYILYERNSLGYVTSQTNEYINSAGSPLEPPRVTRNIYAANGIDLLQSFGPDGQLVAGYIYNSNHLILAATNAAGDTNLNFYNGNGQLTGVKRSSGLYSTNTYFEGFLQASYDYAIVSGVTNYYRSNYFTYATNLVATKTDERGLTQTNFYDRLQRPVRVVYSDGSARSNLYYRLDLVTSWDQENKPTQFNYDAARRMTSVINPLGKVTQYNYCNCGALDSTVDALGNTTAYYYDLLGRLTSVTNVVPGGGYAVTNYYDSLGRKVLITDSFGKSVSNFYDHHGLLICSSNNLFGTILRVQYDINDRPMNVVDASGVTVTNSYDELGRLKTQTVLGISTNTFEYTARGLTNVTDGLNHTHRTALDAAGRVTAETNPNNEVVQYGYNAAGDRTLLTDGANHNTTFGYDVFGRLTSKTNHTGAEIFRYTYFSNGWLKTRWTPQKGTATNAFDAVGNLTNITYSNSPAISLAYDALNRLTSMIDAVGTNNYAYTNLALLSEDGPWADDTVSYTYQQGRRRSGLTVSQPWGGAWLQTYGYDAMGRLKALTNATGVYGYDYASYGVTNAAALVRRITQPGGSYITNTFDTAARLLTTRLLKSDNSTVLNSHGYVYNAGNQRVFATNFFSNYWNYGYDNAGQLMGATGRESGGSLRLHEKFGYAYDLAGNLMRRTNDALIQTFTVNNVNQLSNVTRLGTLTVAGSTGTNAISVTVNELAATRYNDYAFAKDGFALADGTNTFTAIAQNAQGSNTNTVSVYLPTPLTFTYDLNGSMTSYGQKGLEYDDENQLVRVTVTNVTKSEFFYDGKRRKRVRREYVWTNSAWAASLEVRYVYDGNLVIQERFFNPQFSTNVPQRMVSYTRGSDLSGSFQGAGGIGGLLGRTASAYGISATATASYHADGNGNITAMVDTNQVMQARYAYDPFLNILAMSGPLAGVNTMCGSSMEWLKESGIISYLYRVYFPEFHRWGTVDPLEEAGGINLYGFARNAPNNFYDTDGRATTGIATPGIGWVFVEEGAAEAAAAAAQAAARTAALAAAGLGSISCPSPKPEDPCERMRKLSKFIRKYHEDVLVGVSDVSLAKGSQSDLKNVPGLTDELRKMISALYRAAADCLRGRKDVSFNDKRADFLDGKSSNGPGSNTQ